jgi:hypothetical protein
MEMQHPPLVVEEAATAKYTQLRIIQYNQLIAEYITHID